jgi:Caudovirus prohead serine protease
MSHTCPDWQHRDSDRYARHWRLIMALIEPGSNQWTLDPGHAYWIAWAEIRDCVDCLRSALEVAHRQCASDYVLKAGGREAAADAAAAEIEGYQIDMTRNRGKPLPDEELRYWPTRLETRSDGPMRRIFGLGVPYGTRSRLLPGGFYEIVEPRSMAKTLSDKLDVVCRMEHYPEWLLATTDSGSLRLTDDPAVGLSYEADLPDTGAGRDLL